MSSPQHEPTMEEILASIRKIISEDAPEASAPAAAEQASAPQTPHQAPEAESDVLELTQEFVEVHQPAFTPDSAPAMEAPRPDDVIFQADPPRSAPMNALHDGIFSDSTRKAMDDTFASIPDEEPAAPAPRATQSFAPVDGTSVETVFDRAIRESFEPVLTKYVSDNSGTIIEHMKPLIREWMDEHFPALLEGAVRSEVERVVKARAVKR